MAKIYKYTYIKHTDGESRCHVQFIDALWETVEIDGEQVEQTTQWNILDGREFVYSPSITQETMNELMESELLNYAD